MSRGLNKIQIIGHLGADPERRSTQGGTTITTLSVAVGEQWTDKQSGEKKERTEWFRVKLFGKLGDIAADYLAKGRQVYIEGQIRTEKYTDKQGIERYATDVIARDMQMLGGRDGDNRSSSGSRPASAPAPAPASPPADDQGFDSDDIPF